MKSYSVFLTYARVLFDKEVFGTKNEEVPVEENNSVLLYIFVNCRSTALST